MAANDRTFPLMHRPPAVSATQLRELAAAAPSTTVEPRTVFGASNPVTPAATLSEEIPDVVRSSAELWFAAGRELQTRLGELVLEHRLGR